MAIEEFKFKKKAKHYHGTEDRWHALTNGYIEPENMLDDKGQLKELNNAIALIEAFFEQAEDEDLIGEDAEECEEEDEE